MVYEFSSDEQLKNKLEGLQLEIEKAKAEQKRREEMKKNPKPDEVGLSSPCKSPTVNPADYPECTKNKEENVELKVSEKPNCESCKYKEPVQNKQVVQSTPPEQNIKVVKRTRNPRKKAHEKRAIKPMDTIVETVEEPASPPVQEKVLPVEEAKPQVRTVKLTDVNINNQQTALLVVFEFLNYAQTKAVFSIEECAKIWECRKMFTS